MKIMFLDESGDHSLEKIDQSYPMFVLAGCIFDFDYYFNHAEKEIDKLKQEFFSKRNLILRSYDIRKQKGNFSCLVDKSKREKFYSALDDLVEQLDFQIIAAAIRKDKFKSRYQLPNNPYFVCFQFILERSIMYLGKSKEKMMFKIEFRETHNDQKLSKVYDNFRSVKSRFITSKEIQDKLIDLSFNQKIQNIAGMQIADLVAYPIGKWALDKTKENKAFTIIESKLHRKADTDTYLNYGLKIFP